MLFDFDPHTGIKETFHQDGRKITIHKSADISKELAANRVDLNQSKSGWKGAFHKVASIPPIMLEMWAEELKRKGKDPNPLSTANRAFLIAKLNNREYSKLRTKEGNL